MYQQLPEEITLIDTGLFKEGTVACYLLESEGEVAIIETGNYQSTQRLLDLLDQKNIHREKVRYVIPTHVHLDHAIFELLIQIRPYNKETEDEDISTTS